MTTLTELQEIFDIDFPKVKLDKKRTDFDNLATL
jgi:hypothetical protein